MKRHSTSLIIRELIIKTTRYYVMPTRMATIKEKKNGDYLVLAVQQQEPSRTARGG